MKRACFWLFLIALAVPAVWAQDAVTEDLNKLNGKVEDLIASQLAQSKQIEQLRREIAALRDEQAKPTVPYATQEALSRLADSVREVDRKRLEDYEKIRSEILRLGRTLTLAPAPGSTKKPAAAPEPSERSAAPEKGFEHVIQKGETLSVIAQAYRDKHKLKITTDQIIKANPGLKPEKLKAGQKIFIPAS